MQAEILSLREKLRAAADRPPAAARAGHAAAGATAQAAAATGAARIGAVRGEELFADSPFVFSGGAAGGAGAGAGGGGGEGGGWAARDDLESILSARDEAGQPGGTGGAGDAGGADAEAAALERLRSELAGQHAQERAAFQVPRAPGPARCCACVRVCAALAGCRRLLNPLNPTCMSNLEEGGGRAAACGAHAGGARVGQQHGAAHDAAGPAPRCAAGRAPRAAAAGRGLGDVTPDGFVRRTRLLKEQLMEERARARPLQGGACPRRRPTGPRKMLRMLFFILVMFFIILKRISQRGTLRP